MNPIRTLVVDDEPLARSSLRILLESDPQIELLGECGRGDEALAAIERACPELVFLDIEMPGLDGFEILARQQSRRAVVVFVTAYDQHAVRAFEAQALDYVLKPFDDERFFTALRRAKDQVRRLRLEELAGDMARSFDERPRPSAPSPAAPLRYLERIVIKGVGTLSFVSVSEIDWIEAQDYYAQVHSAGKKHLLRQSLRELESRLDPRQFVRIHRSTIVNVDRIKELRPFFHGEYTVVLRDGTELKLSRTHRAQLDQLLGSR